MDWLTTYLSVKAGELLELVYALFFVLAVATIVLLRQSGRARIRAVVQVLLHPKTWTSRSVLLDYHYTAFNILFFPILLGATILGTGQVAGFLSDLLPPSVDHPGWLTETQTRIVLTIVLFLALEFAYWLDHYLSHRIPMLWAFHKVHHSAEVLTPLTIYRVHPLDTIVYYNIKALVTGAVYCIAIFMLGTKPLATWEGTLLVLYMWVYGHLQHTELWITFPGWLNKIFFSPAHHQIHHSKASIHHNTNFGMSLTLFDWMFGTLHTPSRENPHLEFGIQHDAHEHHFGASLIEPLAHAYRRFVPAPRKAKARVDEALPSEAEGFDQHGEAVQAEPRFV